jgi:uncharacterized protein YqhQ
MMSEETYYGGQAVIEGVMIRGKSQMATACRLASGQIRVVTQPVRSILSRHRWLNIPLVRGTPALIDALSIGFRSMLLSADLALEGEGKRPMNRLWFALSLLLALVLGVGLFVILPTMVTPKFHGGLLHRAVSGALQRSGSGGAIASNLVEGVIRMAVLLVYLLVISNLRDVRRLFAYHGAEHQVVNAYEHGRPFSEAGQFSTVHKRCGTAFIAVFIVVGVVVHAFLKWPTWHLRILYRLATVPVIAGISFEIIKAAGKSHESWWYTLIGWPGLLLQRITTRRPSPDQIEVATRAMQSVLEAEGKAP